MDARVLDLVTSIHKVLRPKTTLPETRRFVEHYLEEERLYALKLKTVGPGSRVKILTDNVATEDATFIDWGRDSEDGEEYTVALVLLPTGRVKMLYPDNIEFVL